MTDRDAPVDQLLAEAEECVARMPSTPGARELRARLDQYKRVVAQWNQRPPADDQRQAMRDQVGEVLRIARTTAPTLRTRRQPG
jgi:hypothetical protein